MMPINDPKNDLMAIAACAKAITNANNIWRMAVINNNILDSLDSIYYHMQTYKDVTAALEGAINCLEKGNVTATTMRLLKITLAKAKEIPNETAK